MARLDRLNAARRSSQVELRELVNYAQKQLPGVMELLQVYGGYERVITAVEAYLEPTRPQPFIATSNQSAPAS